ncbi:hypothetical protein BVY01_04835 [bacterium I07]|nr:hypothetical protein BVY01_04835 [bacterium I07]
MQRIIICVICLVIVGIVFSQTGEQINAVEIEIKNTIETSINTFWQKDYQGWANTIIHNNNTVGIWVSKTRNVENSGWANIGSQVKQWMDDNPLPLLRELNITFSQLTVKENMAVVHFHYSSKDQIQKDPDYIPMKCFWVLQKINGFWKISTWVNIGRNSYRAVASEKSDMEKIIIDCG